MVDQVPATRPAERGETYPVRNDRGDISLQFLALIRPALRRRDKERLTQLIKPLHEADVGDLLESLAADERSELVDLLGDDFDYMVLTELDQKVRARLLADLGPHAVADGLRKLESDDAVAVIDDLPPEEQRTVLDRMPLRDRIAVSRSLAYPDETAGRLMQREFVAVPPFWDVGRTIDYLRDDDDLPDDFYEIFVVDTRFHPIGTVALDKLLRRKRPMAINDIANHKVRSVRATEDQEAVARLFERYNLLSAPVIDDDGRLVGVITIDDVVDVIEAEAEEDIRRLAGVGRRESSEAIVSVARARIPWLLVNIATGFLAAAVIGLFDGTIEQMVALAILMPIVASMGGNAGTQAMTVTVRAIATRDIGSQRAHRVVGRELMVAVVNGSVVAVCVGAGAGLWFRDASIGIVIALALIITIFVAGLVGSFIPLILDRLKIDPAVASGVILTAITDVTGFFVFLALAGFWFGLL